jgi:hypothetical protein
MNTVGSMSSLKLGPGDVEHWNCPSVAHRVPRWSRRAVLGAVRRVFALFGRMPQLHGFLGGQTVGTRFPAPLRATALTTNLARIETWRDILHEAFQQAAEPLRKAHTAPSVYHAVIRPLYIDAHPSGTRRRRRIGIGTPPRRHDEPQLPLRRGSRRAAP